MTEQDWHKLEQAATSIGDKAPEVRVSYMTNIDIDEKNGLIKPRKGWKSFEGMVYQLWLVNKRFKKLNIQGDFTVRLPLPNGTYGKKRK